MFNCKSLIIVYGRTMKNIYLSRGLFKFGRCGLRAPPSQTDLQDEREKNLLEFPAHPEYVKLWHSPDFMSYPYIFRDPEQMPLEIGLLQSLRTRGIIVTSSTTPSFRSFISGVWDALRPHTSMHSAFEAKLFPFPLHPLYRNGRHRLLRPLK